MLDNIRKFIHFGNEHGVNNFLLKGPRQVNKEDKGIPVAIIGYFTKTYGPSGTVIALIPPGVDENEYLQKVLELEVPQDVQDLIPDNKDIRDGFEEIVISESYPSFVLVFGGTTQSPQEVVMLYSILGVSAKTALTEIQNGLMNGRQN